MKNIIIILFNLFSFAAFSQISTYDGIELKPTSVNQETYFQGEPFIIYFDLLNNKGKSKYYKYVNPTANCELVLQNLSTGKEQKITLDFDQISNNLRKFMTNAPEEYCLGAKENMYYPVEMNKWFGKQEQEVEGYSYLEYNLYDIPKGDYNLIIKYHLLPSSEILTSFFKFKVIDMPSNEIVAYTKFQAATKYANLTLSNYAYNTTYNENHPDSYNQFIKQYPNSVFSFHANLNLINWVYTHGEYPQEVTSAQNFLNSYNFIQREDHKLMYAAAVPNALTPLKAANIITDVKSELDKYLVKLKTANPTASRILINTAELQYNVSGLKSYVERE